MSSFNELEFLFNLSRKAFHSIVNETTVTCMEARMTEDRYAYYESLGFTREQIDSDLARTEEKEVMDQNNER